MLSGIVPEVKSVLSLIHFSLTLQVAPWQGLKRSGSHIEPIIVAPPAAHKEQFKNYKKLHKYPKIKSCNASQKHHHHHQQQQQQKQQQSKDNGRNTYCSMVLALLTC